jgi:hypothetical protein
MILKQSSDEDDTPPKVGPTVNSERTLVKLKWTSSKKMSQKDSRCLLYTLSNPLVTLVSSSQELFK